MTMDGRGCIETRLIDSPNSSKRSYSGNDSDTSDMPERTRRPMRKRAKTQEEKEQRAQERIMRNRAAAQVSRERKREYVVTLEAENKQLVDKVASLSSENTALQNSVCDLAQRLESMEKFIASMCVVGTSDQADQNDSTACQSITPQSIQAHHTTNYIPPIGTLSPQDIHSHTSASMETIDSRNPAVIVNGPQRRTSMMTFPWILSSRSPFYKQMEILLHWTIIREIASQLIVIRLRNILAPQCHPSRQQFLHKIGPAALRSDGDLIGRKS